MKVKNSFTGQTFDASIFTEHSSRSFHQPLLMVAGESLGTIEALALQIIEATQEERVALQQAGYILQDAAS